MCIYGWTPDFVEGRSDATSLDRRIPPNPHTSADSPPDPRLDTSTPTPGSPFSDSPISPAATPRPSAATPRPAASSRRRGDPSWVARPKNSFFIFRCEFIRNHSRWGIRGGRLPPGSAEMTLSKRAGQAWRKLSPEEKARYVKLAQEEKAQHAKDHPNYQFRPTRREKRKSRTPDRRAAKKTPTAPDFNQAGPIAPRAVGRSQSVSPLEHFENTFGSFHPPDVTQEPVFESRRRSLSVPPLFTFPPRQQHPTFSGFPHELRRAASYQDPMSSDRDYAEGERTSVAGYNSTPISAHQSPYLQPLNIEYPFSVPPLAAVSSTLGDWQEYTHAPAAVPPPILTTPPAWPADSFMCDASTAPMHASVYQGHEVVMVHNGAEYIPIEQPPIAHEFPHFGSPHSAHQLHDTQLGEYSLEAAARNSALQTFEMGLAAEHGSQPNGEYMSFDMPIEEEQKLLDGMMSF